MIRIIRNSNQYHYLVNKYLLDSVADIQDLPTRSISPGSEAIIDSTGAIYRLNNDYEWKLKESGGGGSSDVTKEYVDNLVNTESQIREEEIQGLNDSLLWEASTGEHSIVSKENAAAGGEAKAPYSIAEGYNTKTGINAAENYGGDYAHAEGFETDAFGPASHAEGYQTKTNNIGELATGRNNKSNWATKEFGNAGNTEFSVGIGPANNVAEAKNAFEVMQNGDAYLLGVGNYNGKTINGATSIQTELNKKVNNTIKVNGHALSNNVNVTAEEIEVIGAMGDNVDDALYNHDNAITQINNDIADLQNDKQNKLYAGDNIVIDEDTNTISAVFDWMPDLPTEDGSYVLHVDVIDGVPSARWARQD